MAILNAEDVRTLYNRNAGFYDAALIFYRLAGVTKLRSDLIDRLKLNEGDTVVDLGCGTGSNFPMIHEKVGKTGRIIGVDLSPAMLERAREKAVKHDFDNVSLVESDIREYRYPADMKAVAACFALEMVPEYDAEIKRIAEALPEGGRLGLLGLKHPENWPNWIVELGVILNKPFGVSREYEEFQPWKAVEKHMEAKNFREFYLGAAYRSVGIKHTL